MWPFSLFKKKKKYRPSRPFVRAELPPRRADTERPRTESETDPLLDINNPLSPLNPLHTMQSQEPPPASSHHNPIPDPPAPIDHSHHTPAPDFTPPHQDHSTNSFDFGSHHHH